MKFSDLTVSQEIPARLMRKKDAEKYVGGRRNLEDLRLANWLKPVKQEHSNTTFDKQDIDRAIDRTKREGWPK